MFRNEWARDVSMGTSFSKVLYGWGSGVICLKSYILAISRHLIIILRNTFWNSKILKAPSSHFTIAHSNSNFHWQNVLSQPIINQHTNQSQWNTFGVGTAKTICFAENIASLQIATWFSTSSPQFFINEFTCFIKPLDQAK